MLMSCCPWVCIDRGMDCLWRYFEPHTTYCSWDWILLGHKRHKPVCSCIKVALENLSRVCLILFSLPHLNTYRTIVRMMNKYFMCNSCSTSGIQFLCLLIVERMKYILGKCLMFMICVLRYCEGTCMIIFISKYQAMQLNNSLAVSFISSTLWYLMHGTDARGTADGCLHCYCSCYLLVFLKWVFELFPLL